MKLDIALLAGGDSSEREVSLGSAATVAAGLDSSRYNVWTIDVRGRDWHYTAPDGRCYPVDRNDFSLTVDGRHIPLRYALVMIHGTPGEDGRMQGYLDMMGVPYSSCSQLSSAITFDKQCTKLAVAAAGIAVARGRLIAAGETVDPAALASGLGLPMFVKPNASGSSCGVAKVKSIEQIAPAIAAAREESPEVLAEAQVVGREFGCGVLVAGGREYLLPVTEIVSRREFFDYQAKYTDGLSEEITPAMIDPRLTETLQRMALTAYRACRCRGVVRIDFIVTPEGQPFLIEVNSIPGMSGGSIIPKQLSAAGMTVGGLYDLIIGDTLASVDPSAER
ncbi:D-alanine--D-alanine ligase [Bacteroidia bacterium]|nr:D-alanine--D-alanine ligase [Bacteroidia bacterium]